MAGTGDMGKRKKEKKTEQTRRGRTVHHRDFSKKRRNRGSRAGWQFFGIRKKEKLRGELFGWRFFGERKQSMKETERKTNSKKVERKSQASLYLRAAS